MMNFEGILGGQFAPFLGGQFKSASRGQFVSVLWGQFDRHFHTLAKNTGKGLIYYKDEILQNI